MSTAWQRQREVGSPWLTRAFARTCLWLGPTIGRLMLIPICAFFMATRARERKISREFLARVLDRPVRFADIWRHFFTFSQMVLDRVFILGQNNRGIELIRENPQLLTDALAEGKGCLLLGSHLGSFEASRAIKADRPEVSLRLLMDRQQSPTANAFLEALNPELAEQVIDVGADINAGLAILNALQEGALVALLADRVTGKEKSIQVAFMGEPAPFPVSAQEIAVITGAPVIVFFGLREPRNRYRLVFERMPDLGPVKRGERQAAVRRAVEWYAARLEHHARSAPYNWFNFYDFWVKQ